MPIRITSPTDGARLDIDSVLTFSGTAGGAIVAVSLIADDQFDLGATDVVHGKWSLDHSFSRPGVRKITAKGLDSAGKLVDSFSLQITLVTDPTSCAFRQGLFLVGGHMVFHLPGDSPFFYTSGLAVDADGSPHAYNPQNTGLDNLINAKDSQGNFVGVVTDGSGHPIVQETTLRALRGFDSFRADGPVRAWLLTILRNLFINGYRTRVRAPRSVSLDSLENPDPIIPVEPGPERQVFSRLENEALARAVANLPDDYREVLVLSDMRGMSYQEISEQIGVPIGTVRSRLSRARSRVRRALFAWRLDAQGTTKMGPRPSVRPLPA